jgi:hypothetical protein
LRRGDRFEGVRADFVKVRGHCDYIVLHDVAVDHIPGIEVKRLWEEVKGDYEHHEFLNQDPILPSALGLVVLVCP